MTKEQFLNGTPFYIGKKSYKGDSTYYYSESAKCICRQSRSSMDERIVLDSYEANVLKVGRLGFTGITYVLGKRVVVKLIFAGLVEFKEEA